MIGAPAVRASSGSSRAGFSLIEMMIAIVILGLGLTMVATIFPVAWDRARSLSEHTIEQSVTDGVAVLVESTLQPGGMRDEGTLEIEAIECRPPDGVARLAVADLAGDLILDPQIYHKPSVPPQDLWKAILNVNDPDDPGFASDTRVHALHLENVLAISPTPPTTVAENPWELEQIGTDWLVDLYYPDPDFPRQLACGFMESSFLTPRFPVNLRVHPPLESIPSATQPGGAALRRRWLSQLERRRFAWAILHRLGDYVGPTPDDFYAWDSGLLTSEDLADKAALAWGSSRVFDVYYVTLRRPNATNRYAVQDPNFAPNPNLLSRTPATIGALAAAANDVQFPVAWRVQVQLPPADTLNSLVGGPERQPTGIPTSVSVPPAGADDPMVDMMISMFPQGTRFVDEINGKVYRVVSVDLNEDGSQAILSLDREITLEDIDLPELTTGGVPTGPPECPTCRSVTPMNLTADPEELLRTVWVYPPPVDRRQDSAAGFVVFDGRSPVSSIEVRTASLAPPKP